MRTDAKRTAARARSMATAEIEREILRLVLVMHRAPDPGEDAVWEAAMDDLHEVVRTYDDRVRRGFEKGDPVDVAQGLAIPRADDRVFLREKKHMEEIKAIAHYVGISVSGWARNRLLMAARREERERTAIAGRTKK